MKVAQLAALVIGVTLSLSALAGALAPVSAQGATADYPTGYGRTMSVVNAPSTDALASLSPAQQLAYLVGLRFAPAGGGSSAGSKAGFQNQSKYRPAGGSGERRPSYVLTNRSSVRPVGR